MVAQPSSRSRVSVDHFLPFYRRSASGREPRFVMCDLSGPGQIGLAPGMAACKRSRALTSAIKTQTSRELNEIAPALRAAVEGSGSRVAETIDKTLTLRTLSKQEKVARECFAADLKTQAWLCTFRGRDVLKRFVAHHGGGISYEAFRDLVLARMRDASFKPEGMRKVLDNILTAGTRPGADLKPKRKPRAVIATSAKSK